VKILFCSWLPLVRELGTPQTLIDLASSLSRSGWACDLKGPLEIGLKPGYKETDYPSALKYFLKVNADKYDVVDFDHAFLPYPRSEFSSQPIFVARAQLLVHQLEKHPFPIRRGTLSSIKHALLGWKIRQNVKRKIESITQTLKESDGIIVLNDDDRDCLISEGIDSNKIGAIAPGLTEFHLSQLQAIPLRPPKDPCIGFVGTFDFRKGALDFPKIVDTIIQQVPNAHFRLLGTWGLFRSETEIRSFFPESVQSRIEIVLRYPQADLPKLLEPCSVGVFPSYVEGFGLGVLEMLAASIPVIAYDVPGPPMMLTSEYLVHPGDFVGLGSKVVRLLSSEAELIRARDWAHRRAQEFTVENTARKTSEFYKKVMSNRR